MSGLVIKNATVLTLDESYTVIKNGYVAVRGEIIEAIGEGEPPESHDTVIDGRGKILFPGFVNTHCHASMIPFRTMGDDCMDRLRRFLFPLEKEAVTPKLVYLGAKYGICEMLLSGITTFCDMYYFEDEVARAAEEMGIRGYLGETIIGQSTCVSDKPYAAFDYQEGFLEKYRFNPRIHPIIAPHGTTTCDKESLQRAHELAVKYNTLLTLHSSEMDYEMQCFAEKGTTPTKYLRDIGVLDKHFLSAHSIHMTDEDIALLAQNGASVAHCIASNTKAGKGVAPIKAMLQNGVRVGLGTDGPSSGNTLSMFDQLRLFANFHKTAHHDRSLFSAKEILRLATVGGANALGGRDYGMIKPNMQADMVMVETDSVNMFPAYNPYSTLVYSANASNVDTVIAAGKILVRGKKLLGQDLYAIRQELLSQMQPFLSSAQKYADII